jgi:hypothetical protein
MVFFRAVPAPLDVSLRTSDAPHGGSVCEDPMKIRRIFSKTRVAIEHRATAAAFHWQSEGL